MLKFLLALSLFSSPAQMPLTKENVYHEIKKQGIKYPELVFAQAMLESGELRSKLTRTNHNIFGMKLPSVRETLAKGSRHNHAYYIHWTESIRDYKLYQDFVIQKKGLTNYKKYLAYINRVYSQTGDYYKRISRVIREHKPLINKYETVYEVAYSL